MKRARVNRSSTFDNIGVVNPPSAAASTFRWEPCTGPSIITPYAPQPKTCGMTRVGILTVSPLSSRVAVDNGQRQRRKSHHHFLDKCFFCGKRMHQYDTRFMYGDFRAFCTLECRTKQIAIDYEKEKSKNGG